MARECKRKRDETRFGKPRILADMILAAGTRAAWTLPIYAVERYSQEQFDYAWSCVEGVRGGLARCPVVSAENACEVYWQHPRDSWDYREDFPCTAPAFPEFFVETTHPGTIVVEGGRIAKPAEWCPDRWGFFVESQTVDGQGIFPIPGEDGGLVDLAIPEARWFLRLMLVASQGGRLMFYPCFAFFPVDPTGRILRYPTVLGGNATLTEEEWKGAWSYVDCLMKPILFAISFMNCKNVTLDPIEPPREFARERRKAGLKPFVRFHTINIEPMKKVLRTEGNVEANGLKKALHIVRGHFSHYSEDKPLFGRPGLHGSFWMPAHTRGSLDHGIIVSDYKVNPPQAGANP